MQEFRARGDVVAAVDGEEGDGFAAEEGAAGVVEEVLPLLG